MVAICSYVRSRASMPHLVALVAAEEVVDDLGQQACSMGQLCWAWLSTASLDILAAGALTFSDTLDLGHLAPAARCTTGL